jgi:hypothetical protein
VLKFRDAEVLGESHKMRMTTAYGLERFWGEQFRLMRESNDKADFWKETWKELHDIMNKAGINVPNDTIIDPKNTAQIKEMTNKLWDETHFPIEQRKVTLAVLIQLCDSLVWWTQRYKKPREGK